MKVVTHRGPDVERYCEVTLLRTQTLLPTDTCQSPDPLSCNQPLACLSLTPDPDALTGLFWAQIDEVCPTFKAPARHLSHDQHANIAREGGRAVRKQEPSSHRNRAPPIGSRSADLIGCQYSQGCWGSALSLPRLAVCWRELYSVTER